MTVGSSMENSFKSMKHFRFRLLTAFLLLAGLEGLAQEKTAAIVGNCRSLNIGPTSHSDPFYGTLTAYFTTYDGRTDVFPLNQDLGNGSVLLNGELRPRTGQPGVYEADFATYSSVYGWVQYGSIVANLPVTDLDANGLPDVAQLAQNGSASISGTTQVDWPSAGTGTFTGTLSRGPNQIFGAYNFTYATDGSTSAGTLQAQNVSGSVTYVRGTVNQATLNLTQTDPVGATRGFTGVTTFTVATTDQIVFPQFSVRSGDHLTNTFLGGLILNRTGPKYVGKATLADGIAETYWADAVNWVLEITDINDSNTNGIPDLSEAMTGPPSIVTQPQSQAVTAGANASFSVNAAGAAILHYQWRFNGANLAGATASTLTVPKVQASNAGPYTVVVTNLNGRVTSSEAILMVNQSPAITSQPQSQAAMAGSNVTFNLSASGTSPLSYRWRFNGANIPGGTNSSLTLIHVQTANAGAYSVIVTNVAGMATSTNAMLTVNTAPLISIPPKSQSVKTGANVVFTATATGTAPFSYQWRFNGARIPGAIAASYSVNNVQVTNAGNYTVGVSNVTRMVASATASLYVNAPLQFINPGLSSNGLFQGQLIGFATSNYIIQASSDLTNWSSLATNSAPSGIISYRDTNHVNAGHRFYRAKPKP